VWHRQFPWLMVGMGGQLSSWLAPPFRSQPWEAPFILFSKMGASLRVQVKRVTTLGKGHDIH